MKLKECLEMIYVACTNYDKEITGKLGTEREYEGSYEQAYDTALKELDKKDKVIDLMAEEITYMDYIGKIPSKKHIKERFYKKVEEENV